MSVGRVVRDRRSEAFFDGTAREQLLLARCVGGHFSLPDASRCHECGEVISDLSPASGRATLVAWSTVAPPRGSDPAARPVVAIVAELAEGPWWWTQLLHDGAPPSLDVGMPLEVDFATHDDDSEAVPVFRVATST